MSLLGGVFGSERNRFGEKVLTQVLRHAGVEFAEFDREAFEIPVRLRNGGTGRIVLHTLFKRCQGQPDSERERRVADLIEASLAGVPNTWDEVAGLLRPVLRGSGRLHQNLEGFDGREVLVWRPALPYLVELVVVDSPRTMHFVSTLDLERWGVDTEQVFRAAHVNMAAMAMGVLDVFEPPTGTKIMEFADESGESYVGSLPLLAGWLAGVRARTGVQPIVLLPAHLGMFMILGSDEAHLPAYLSMAEDKYNEALRPLSPLPYTVDEAGELVPLQVSQDHPAWHSIHRMETRLSVRTYATQTEYLRAAPYREEAVSELMLLWAPDGTEYTMTPWTDGVPTLLPRAHFICMVTISGEVFRVAWEDVASLVHLEPVAGYDPPRYRVEDHPPAEIMDQLRALSS